jgi:hypothetical protein
MTILTSSTSACYKAQIRSSPERGFEQLYTATCTESELCAAKTVVRKNFGHPAAESVRQVKDADEIKQLTGDYFRSPQIKQVFNVWTFNPQAS